MNIEVNVSNKIARLADKDTVGVCGNSDYVIHFNFDDEWNAYETKTARFKWGGSYTDVVFTGNQCNMPVIYDSNRVEIGVFAGDLHTTTSALLKMKKSVLCGSGSPADPAPDVYNQMMQRMAELETPDWNQNDSTKKDYIKNRTHYVEPVETELIPKTEFTISSADENYYNFTVDDEPNSGDSCTVVFDGVSYARQAKVVNDDIVVGNAAIWGTDYDDTGEPFAIDFWFDDDMLIASVSVQALGSHTISTSWFHDVVHTLDPKYIKDMYYSKTEYTELTGYDGWAYISNQQAVTLPLVEINGVKYTDCKGLSSNQYVFYYIGGGSISFDRGQGTMSFNGFGDITEDDILFYTMVTKVTTIPEKYIPETIARTEQIVKPNWNTVDESAPSAILNKPEIGFSNIDDKQSSGVTITLPTFTIPSNAIGVILKIEQLTIQNYSEGDVVYINDGWRKIPGEILQGNNLMIRLYRNASHTNAQCISIVTEYGSDYMEPVLAMGMDFVGWNKTSIKIFCSGKTIKCSQYGFFSV